MCVYVCIRFNKMGGYKCAITISYQNRQNYFK